MIILSLDYSNVFFDTLTRSDGERSSQHGMHKTRGMFMYERRHCLRA